MSAPAACSFPLFRQRYLLQALDVHANVDAAPGLGGASCPSGPPQDPALSPTKGAAARMGSLRVLDLRALPRDDGPPTELRARKEKLAHFERQCSRVADGLYVGAEWVAKSREALADAGITHVVNCVGFLYPPYFEGELAYQTLYLQGGCCVGWRQCERGVQGAAARRRRRRSGRESEGHAPSPRAPSRAPPPAPAAADTPGEDLLCVLYDVFDFIEVGAGARARAV